MQQVAAHPWTTPDVTEATGEFATEPVPAERAVPWYRVGFVATMVAFSLPTFITGIEVFRATDGRTALLAILLGNLLLSLIGATSGAIGARTRLSSYMLARIAFGVRGAALVNLAFALSLLGWFGVNIDLFGDAVLRLLDDVYGINPPTWVVELAAGVVMTVTTLVGFRAIDRLSLLLVPVLMLVTAMLVAEAVAVKPAGELLSMATAEEISFGRAMSAVVGGVVIGAIILPDITRFVREWHGGIYIGFLSYLGVGSVVQVAGGLAAIAFDNSDLLDVMIAIGLGWAAFAIVICGSWILNSLNLYSAMLSVEATFPALPNRLLVFALGALGTLAAFLNILDAFLDFLYYLAVVFAPVAGVLAVDYLWNRRSAYHEDRHVLERRIMPAALLAWAAGALVAIVGPEVGLSLTGVAALDAIGVAALLHAVAGGIANRRGGDLRATLTKEEESIRS